jgi:ammonia channel protein AmtB
MEGLILSFLAPFGLTLFRTGQSQSKNLVKSLTKFWFHLPLGIVGFWLLGSGLSGDGENGFAGTKIFFSWKKWILPFFTK